MNISILTVGSRGDVQPYIALGAGLTKSGHVVRLPGPEIFRNLVSQSGLVFVPTHSYSPQDFIKRPDIQEAIQRGNQVKVLTTLLKESGPMMESMLTEFWEACQDADLIITSGAFYFAFEGAEKADTLGQLITTVVADTTMQAKAAEIGIRIRTENGIAAAIDVIHRHAKWQ
jgi:sterol 3beta-glucosyltransferase